MSKITFKHKDFFKSHKNSSLILYTISGIILVNSIAYEVYDSQYLAHTAEVKNSRELDYCSCQYEPGSLEPEILDRIVWDEEYVNIEPKVYIPSHLDSNIVKAVIFKGSSKATHYRITFKENELEWNELPNNDIIIFNLHDIPEQFRYNQGIEIQFGTYNPYLGSIDENNSEFLVETVSSKEEMEEHAKVHEKIISIANKIVSNNDSEFEKTKKIYDYLIKHAEYRYSEKGIYGQALFNKYYMDCVGYAEFMNLALNSVGVECISVQDNTHGHVWNIVKIEDKYYHLDATYSDTSSWYHTSRYRYFLVSDEFMLADHRFFVSEKNVSCNDIYDLTGIVSDKDVEYRGFKGEQINSIVGDHKIGEIIDSGYSLVYRSR